MPMHRKVKIKFRKVKSILRAKKQQKQYPAMAQQAKAAAKSRPRRHFYRAHRQSLSLYRFSSGTFSMQKVYNFRTLNDAIR